MEAQPREEPAAVYPELERCGQIRSRERVRGLAEVYTHEREVKAMLDLVPEMFPSPQAPGNTDRTFLEPTCGHGNFLVEILRRKIEYVTPRRYGRGERFEHRLLRGLASIYGIDISEDNVRQSRERMRAVVADHLQAHLGFAPPTAGFSEAVEAILETNVIRADSLAAAEIVLVEYQPGPWGTFSRRWSRLEDDASGSRPSSTDLRCDQAPVHYSDLAENPGPVLLHEAEREAA